LIIKHIVLISFEILNHLTPPYFISLWNDHDHAHTLISVTVNPS